MMLQMGFENQVRNEKQGKKKDQKRRKGKEKKQTKLILLSFLIQVMQLVNALGDHQTLLFSATIPPAIEKMAQTIMNDPVFVAVGSVC